MKKRIFLVLLLLLLFVLAITVHAADSTVTVSEVTGKTGDRVQIHLSLGDFYGIASMKYSIEYDDTNLTLIGIECSTDIPGYFQISETYNTPAILNWYNTENISGNCDFATLTFVINDSAYAGEYIITLGVHQKDTLGYNVEGELIRYEFPIVSPGKITVETDSSEFIEINSITLNNTALSLEVNEKASLIATISPTDATNSSITWYSSNNDIATVDTNGNVTGISSGKVTITAVGDNISASCKITVTEAHVHSYTEMVPIDIYMVSSASCTTRATYYYSCSCGLPGENVFEYGSYEPHSFGEWVIVTEPTETATGVQERSCITCTIAKETQTIPTIGHSNHIADTSKWLKDETHHWHMCVDCDKKLDVEEHHGGMATCIELARCEICAQSYGEFTPENHADVLAYVEEVAATCTVTGIKAHYNCAACDKNYSDEVGTDVLESIEIPVDADNHVNTEVRDAVKPNGEQAGYTGDTYCLDCGKKIAEGEEYNYILGDVNSDGNVNRADLILLSRYFAGNADISEINQDAADVTQDGNFNRADLIKMKKYFAGSIDSLE